MPFMSRLTSPQRRFGLFLIIGLLAVIPGTLAAAQDDAIPVSADGRQIQERYGDYYPDAVATAQGGQVDVTFAEPQGALRAAGPSTPFQNDLIDHAIRSRVIDLDVGSLIRSLATERVSLALFDDVTLDVVTHLVPSAGDNDSIVYYGQDRTSQATYATMTIVDGSVFAKFQDRNRRFVIEPWTDGTHVIVEDGQPAPAGDESDDSPATDFGDTPAAADAIDPAERQNVDGLRIGTVTHITTDARDRYGSDAIAIFKATQYINETNVAFANSNVNAHLVSAEIAITNSRNRNSVAERRDQLGADVGALIFDGSILKDPGEDNDTTTCGNAVRWNEGSTRANIVASVACSDGQFTFTHEIGHIFDANHEDDFDDPPARGFTNYDANFRTLMSKTAPPRVLYFSNPDVFYNGAVTGTNSQNNVQTMNAVANQVANIGQADFVDPPPVDISSLPDLRAHHSGKCAEIAGAGLEALGAAQQATCTDSPNQKLGIVDIDGAIRVQFLHSGLCIDVSGGGSDPGAPIIQWSCHGDDNQLMDWDGAQLKFRHSGLCLTVQGASQSDGTPLVQDTCTNAANQRWSIDGSVPAPTPTPTPIPTNTPVPTVTPDPATSVSVSLDDYSIGSLDGQRTVELRLDPGDSTVGAIALTIDYDATLVAPVLDGEGLPACTVTNGGGGTCGPAGPDGSISVALFNSSPGWDTDGPIVAITFNALGTEGTSPLTISVETVSDLEPVRLGANVDNGSITIADNAAVGDVNCDGRLNIVDALIVAQYAAGIRSGSSCDLIGAAGIELANGDFNDDGRVDIVDALLIARCDAGLCE